MALLEQLILFCSLLTRDTTKKEGGEEDSISTASSEQDTHTGGGVHMCKMSQILFSTIWFLYIALLSILQ